MYQTQFVRDEFLERVHASRRSALLLDYDGTLAPFATGFFLCTLAALAVVLAVEKGRLFRPHGVKV
jgi:hypothetical protein